MPGNTTDRAQPRGSQPQVRAERLSIHVPDDVLDDLHARISGTRWPNSAPGRRWEQGTDVRDLRELLASWVERFDWHVRESELNSFAHFTADVDGTRIHFVHEHAWEGRGIP